MPQVTSQAKKAFKEFVLWRYETFERETLREIENAEDKIAAFRQKAIRAAVGEAGDHEIYQAMLGVYDTWKITPELRKILDDRVKKYGLQADMGFFGGGMSGHASILSFRPLEA